MNVFVEIRKLWWSRHYSVLLTTVHRAKLGMSFVGTEAESNAEADRICKHCSMLSLKGITLRCNFVRIK